MGLLENAVMGPPLKKRAELAEIAQWLESHMAKAPSPRNRA